VPNITYLMTNDILVTCTNDCVFYRMKKFFPVLSRDKASSSTNQEPSNTQHPSEPQSEVTPNSANEGIQVVDYKFSETDPGLRSPI
jgi:hypothetical protein